jgi:hypothetical protein
LSADRLACVEPSAYNPDFCLELLRSVGRGFGRGDSGQVARRGLLIELASPAIRTTLAAAFDRAVGCCRVGSPLGSPDSFLVCGREAAEIRQSLFQPRLLAPVICSGIGDLCALSQRGIRTASDSAEAICEGDDERCGGNEADHR